MAEYSTPEQRTEPPTARRMGQLRKQGSVHLSTEMAQVATLFVGFMLLSFLWSGLYENMKSVMVSLFKLIGTVGPRNFLDVKKIEEIILGVLWVLSPKLLLQMGLVAVAAILAVMLQTKWNVREKWIKFRWDLVKPIQGLMRIFSIQGVVTTLKSLFKLAIILPIGYFALEKFAPQMVLLTHYSVTQTLTFSGAGIKYIFWKVLYVLILFAVFDYFWTRYQWFKTNRMTKDEVKDERKSVEGDEETRRRITAKGLQRIAQRIHFSVPKADVVVTNPTHISVALKYDRKSMVAPVVLAKGKGFVAQRIREIARESGVPILERKPLARALFESTEVGAIIPRDLFKAVAEVLAYVYRLKNPHLQQGGSVN